ncbi:carcinoembryonic antigen-related cell adhesion molecule 21-like [Pseudorasbora parva]|uniref:carcinoembryonic antigen-related cell adhesion molecule 21-like n=1 Tax=Pseudorasbora parva TaxID=51549 RepID=UPI00351E4B23
MAPPLPLIVLLMIHGVSSAGWGVSYSASHICALNDSTVIMRCSYTYPTGHQIMKVFWTKVYKKGVEPPDLSEDPEYSQRLQYLGDKQQNCTGRLSHVTLKDSHEYYFRVITDKEKWLGKPGVTLTVTDLQVESPERVTEGDSVRLTCKSSCTLTDRATFIWSRNSQPLPERRDGNNELLLQSVRREDAGRYSCAVHGHTHTSPDVYLNVTSAGHPVILYVSVGVVCGAAVIFTMLLIWGSRWMKKRKDTQETQMVQSIPHHDKQQVCDVELNEPVYENVTAHQLDDCKSDLNTSVYENLPMRL